jgi:ABC-type iron transport system FetAB permease component
LLEDYFWQLQGLRLQLPLRLFSFLLALQLLPQQLISDIRFQLELIIMLYVLQFFFSLRPFYHLLLLTQSCVRKYHQLQFVLDDQSFGQIFVQGDVHRRSHLIKEVQELQ